MPDFILTGEPHDAVTVGKAARPSEQHQVAEADGSADQLESGERHQSLTLVHREYSYQCLKSWWQSIGQQVSQCGVVDGSPNDSANYEAIPREGGSGRRQTLLEEQLEAEEREQTLEPQLGAEEREQTPEPQLESRRLLPATPDALFLAEKLQQLADTTREMAQRFLSPEARRLSAASCQTPNTPLDPESRAGSGDVELMRQKILLLDDVVTELSQYRMSPLALDMSERLKGEPSPSQRLRNESATTCNNSVVESTNSEGGDFQQLLDMSNSASSIEEDTLYTTPCATECPTTLPNSVFIADKNLIAGVPSEQGTKNAELHSANADDPSAPSFAAILIRDEIRISSIQLPQREPQMYSSTPNFDACNSDVLSKELQFCSCHLKVTGRPTQRMRTSVSQRDRLDRVITTVQRLLGYPVLSDILNDGERNTAADNTMVDQAMPQQLVRSELVTSVAAPSQKEPQMNTSASLWDTSHRPSRKLRFSTCHEDEPSGTAYQSQQDISQPGGLDGMIALVQRLLRLQIMGACSNS